MNYELCETDRVNLEIPLIFFIKISKNWKANELVSKFWRRERIREWGRYPLIRKCPGRQYLLTDSVCEDSILGISPERFWLWVLVGQHRAALSSESCVLGSLVVQRCKILVVTTVSEIPRWFIPYVIHCFYLDSLDCWKNLSSLVKSLINLENKSALITPGVWQDNTEEPPARPLKILVLPIWIVSLISCL